MEAALLSSLTTRMSAVYLFAALACIQQQWRKRQLGRRCWGRCWGCPLGPPSAAAASQWTRWQQTAGPSIKLCNTSRFFRHAAWTRQQGHNFAQCCQQDDGKYGSGGRLYGLHSGAVLTRCCLFLEPHHSGFYATRQCLCAFATIAVLPGEGFTFQMRYPESLEASYMIRPSINEFPF